MLLKGIIGEDFYWGVMFLGLLVDVYFMVDG